MHVLLVVASVHLAFAKRSTTLGASSISLSGITACSTFIINASHTATQHKILPYHDPVLYSLLSLFTIPSAPLATTSAYTRSVRLVISSQLYILFIRS